jgi:hypothetical protein
VSKVPSESAIRSASECSGKSMLCCGADAGSYPHETPVPKVPLDFLKPDAEHMRRAQGGHHIAKLASAAKAKVGEAGRYVGEQAVQLHGGMCMSNELKVGHYLKRLIAINIQYGDPTFHIMRCAEDVFGLASALQRETSVAAHRAAAAA